MEIFLQAEITSATTQNLAYFFNKMYFLAQLDRLEVVNTRREHYSPRVEGSIPVRGNFFAEFILL